MSRSTWKVLLVLSVLAVVAHASLTATEQAKLTAADAAASDRLGRTIALAGDTVVAGAPTGDTPSTADTGSAYVFVRSGTAWSQEAELYASDAAFDDSFGYSVAVDADTALVGSFHDDDGGTDSGSAYVFVRSGTTWTEEQKLVASDDAAFDYFAHGVGVSGDTAVVGALLEDQGGSDAGAAYVFVRSGTTWTEQQKLLASDSMANDFFGVAVAISGDTLVVGANGDDGPAGSGQGGAYVFVRSGTTWTEQQKLIASDASAGDKLGASVAIDGDTVVVGATVGDAPAAANSGSAYVFVRSGTTWTQQAELTAGDPALDDDFGVAVGVDGDTVAVGSWRDDDAGSASGSVYVYARVGSRWIQQRKITASDAAGDDRFGDSIGVSGDTVAVASFGDDDGGSESGSAYVYVLAGESTAFCDASDASHAACPCSNVGSPDAGCDIAQATGGVVASVAGQDTVGNQATIVGTGFPLAASPTALVIRANGREATPVVFGDGLRCVNTVNLVRLAATVASGGSSTHVFGHNPALPPASFYYQVWFRNTPATFCDSTAAFNLSSGRVLFWP